MDKANNNVMRYVILVGFPVALFFILFLHGAIPFLAVPTLGQAVWTTGFSQSFINQSPFTIHATNFGFPRPAAIAFGLAGAYPAGLLITLGLNPVDAYAAMAAIWLTVAFFGAWRLSLLLGLSGLRALLTTVLWMSMPIIWAHASNSMLSLGIALLPFYIWIALQVIIKRVIGHKDLLCKITLFIVTCIIAVFMDGYTYVMFAVGVAVLGVFSFFYLSDLRRHLIVFALPTIIVAFALSYFLYTAYIGQSFFEPETMDFFRGWGVDLTFIAMPTRGMHWFWDTVGLSVVRSNRYFFGDSNVWISTFSLPIIIAGLAGWWRMKAKSRLATGFLLLSLFGFYMALGPSLKLNSTRSESMIESGDFSPLMLEEQAIAPTGNAILSENVPGFQQMRASYRWHALGMVGFWGLIVIWLGSLKLRIHLTWGLLLVAVLIVFNLPNFNGTWQRAPVLSNLDTIWQARLEDISYTNNRKAFLRMENEIIYEMRNLLQEEEIVAFLPYRNDFLVNYIAARLNIRAFNIGGDKNLFTAKEHWPSLMKGLHMGQICTVFADRILLLLANREVDAVVLPYIDMLWAAHFWPAPVEFSEQLAPVIAELNASEFVTIHKREHYAVVRIAPDYLDELENGTISQKIMERQGSIYPIAIRERSNFALLRALLEGWYDIESTHVWSSEEAKLRLPIKDVYAYDRYAAKIAFFPYGASTDRSVSVIFETYVNDSKVSYEVVLRSPTLHLVLIPLTSDCADQIIRISVPDAVSPKTLHESPDTRILGIALRSIDSIRISPYSRIGTILRVCEFNKQTPTQVGALHDGELATTGSAGFLVFGPYATISAGEYELVVKGTAATITESVWADVVSEQGKVQHAKFKPSSPVENESGTLISGHILLTEAVDDLEIRVYVGENDNIRLEGYELVPITRKPIN